MISDKDFQTLLYAANRVRKGQDWAFETGLEYWVSANLMAQGVGVVSGGLMGVTNNGWVNTGTVVGVAGSLADFMVAADPGTGGYFNIDTAADLLNSPALFGSYDHAAAVCALIGRENSKGEPDLPRFLIYDNWGTSFAANNAETGSGHGFVEGAGAASVANDHLACFTSTTTHFKLRSGAATTGNLMAADTARHRWRVKIDLINALAYAYIDDMSTALGSIAIEADLFPCSVGAGVVSGGANFILWGPSRVRYAWDGWV